MAGLLALPEELLQQIADHLDRTSLRALALSNSLTWEVATNALWRCVNLIDTHSQHHVPNADLHVFHGRGPSGRDDHDDAPIVRKLLVLARNERLAKKVRVLTHRCHLPLPAIFQDLPRMDFHNPTLSCDWRTMQLALLAVQNMDGVRVLRLLNGHYNLVSALLNGFYGPQRRHVPPHLWIESCSLHGFPLYFASLVGKENGLLSLRLRRLKMANVLNTAMPNVRFSRAKGVLWLHNGKGNTYSTPAYCTSNSSGNLNDMDDNFSFTNHVNPAWMLTAPDCVKWLNKKTYEQVPGAVEFLDSHGSEIPKPMVVDNSLALSRQAQHVSDTIGIITHFNASSLRSLNLDWILNFGSGGKRCLGYAHFERLSKLKFPSLRAFQLRNAVTENTLLPENVYLLHPYTHYSDQSIAPVELGPHPKPEHRIDFLTFMESHPNLECLAWPMDRFYAALKPHEEDDGLRDRAAAVVANLGRTLVNLRVDYYYTSRGEPQTDDAPSVSARAARKRRRAFISDFAAHMTKLTVLKLEGGIPRDEKREMMAATSRCPIEKLVMIAVSCPLGNTWGVNGDELSAIDEGQLQFHGLLEAEPEEALLDRTNSEFVPYSGSDGAFRAEYGWPAGPSLLHSIATYHASTITELKFCGYNGSPILHKPTPITKMLLHHLRHFHRLQKVVMSFWLLTFFDFDWREPEIIDYWLDSREATSTALVPVPEPAPAPTEPPTWESLVAANTGNVDQDGDVDMGEQDAAALAVGPVLGALSALDGHVDGADDDLNPDAMMAAALGTGLLFATADGTIVPPNPASTNAAPPPPPNPAATLHHAPPPPTTDTDTEDDFVEPNPWERYLRRRFSPRALSYGVHEILGPHLSPIALSSEEGVQVRASFCLGVESGDIFDLDFLVRAEKGGWGPVIGAPPGVGVREEFHPGGSGVGGKVRSQVVEGSWVGPREESEKSRWWGKLEERGWFG